MNEFDLIAKALGAGGCSGVFIYLTLSKLLPSLNGKSKIPSVPCAPLQVAQSQVQSLEADKVRQWDTLEDLGKAVGRIEGTTQTILTRITKP
jgi:hypothetical protein